MLMGCAGTNAMRDVPETTRDRDATTMDVEDTLDHPTPGSDDVSDGDTGVVDSSRDTGPLCLMRRMPVGTGVGPGADRCDGVAPPVQGMGATWCSLGQPIPGLVEPPGFCVRRFFESDRIMPRSMAIAPNGDLFVSSPGTTTGAGDVGGLGEILVMSDDNRDGVAEVRTFATRLATVHAIAFSADRNWLYFTMSDGAYRTAYRPGLRAEMDATREVVASGADASAASLARGRWTHGLAISVNNRVLMTTAENPGCMFTPTGQIVPGAGAIFEVGSHVATRVGAGFRNPMYARCHYCRDLCLAAELGDDGVNGAIEKLVIIDGERWHGYPCCHRNNPDPSLHDGACGCVDELETAIHLGDTPFGFDWERGAWPEPYRNSIFAALHGTYYQGAAYTGAGVVFFRTDPVTGRPTGGPPIRLLEPTNGNDWQLISLSRPSDVVFSNDGRLFIADDHGRPTGPPGMIPELPRIKGVYWMAPTTFRIP